jgi:hypothetical protein
MILVCRCSNVRFSPHKVDSWLKSFCATVTVAVRHEVMQVQSRIYSEAVMRFKMRSIALAAALSVIVSGQSRANMIVNGSFENGTNPPPLNGSGVALPTGSTAITGWTVIGGTGGDGLAWLPNGNPYGVSTTFGNNFLDLTGYLDRSPYFGVSQSISTTVGQSYTLTLNLGVDQGTPAYGGPIAVQVQAGPVTETITDNPAGTGNIWTAFNVNFTADSTSTLISIQGTEGNQYIGLDNVSLNAAAVPEPGSLALGGIATVFCLGCWCLRRRKFAGS